MIAAAGTPALFNALEAVFSAEQGMPAVDFTHSLLEFFDIPNESQPAEAGASEIDVRLTGSLFPTWDIAAGAQVRNAATPEENLEDEPEVRWAPVAVPLVFLPQTLPPAAFGALTPGIEAGEPAALVASTDASMEAEEAVDEPVPAPPPTVSDDAPPEDARPAAFALRLKSHETFNEEARVTAPGKPFQPAPMKLGKIEPAVEQATAPSFSAPPDFVVEESPERPAILRTPRREGLAGAQIEGHTVYARPVRVVDEVAASRPKLVLPVREPANWPVIDYRQRETVRHETTWGGTTQHEATKPDSMQDNAPQRDAPRSEEVRAARPQLRRAEAPALEHAATPVVSSLAPRTSAVPVQTMAATANAVPEAPAESSIPATTMPKQALELDAHQSTSSAPLREIRMVVAPTRNAQEPVALRLTERHGEIVVDVRTTDRTFTGEMRNGLPQLVDRLDRAGYQAEVFHPVAVSTQHDAPLRSTPNGSERNWPGGDNLSGRQHGGQPQDPEHRQKRQQQPEWRNEIEQQIRRWRNS